LEEYLASVIYRTYRSSDLDALLILISELGYEQGKQTLIRNIDFLRKAGGEVFVVEKDKAVCACVSAIIDIRLAEGVCGEIVSLVVAEKARGLGLGKGLCQHAENWLFKRVDKVRIRANSIRSKALEFYRSLGYEEIKTQSVLVKVSAVI
jgi:ribosomal protein S18 acetylase RimI-like enzyme